MLTCLNKDTSVLLQVTNFEQVNMRSIKTFVLLLLKILCRSPYYSYKMLGIVKYTSHTIPCLTVLSHAFYNSRFENFLKGPALWHKRIDSKLVPTISNE